MAKSRVDLVAEALTLIENGEITVAEGPRRFSETWEEISPEVLIAMRISRSAQPPLVSERPFRLLDKAMGWNTLKTQLEAARPIPVPSPVRRPVRPKVSWLARWEQFIESRWRRPVFASMLTGFTVFLLALSIGQAGPGDWLYRAKLGWESLSEVTSLSVDEKAQASLAYADHRLSELEKLAFVGRPEQVAEVEGQYLRGLDTALRYTDSEKFTQYVAMYNRLNDQRDRVVYLQRTEYVLGPRSQMGVLLNRLDLGVNNLGPKIPGNNQTPPPPSSTPGPLPPSSKP